MMPCLSHLEMVERKASIYNVHPGWRKKGMSFPERSSEIIARITFTVDNERKLERDWRTMFMLRRMEGTTLSKKVLSLNLQYMGEKPLYKTVLIKEWEIDSPWNRIERVKAWSLILLTSKQCSRLSHRKDDFFIPRNNSSNGHPATHTE